ncbi:hypothetical protein [Paenibacillus sp. N3.4]|uniref:hypothetical protein n=1 Tax=Paenibacillus sp. N3.4 TaxID=2603222 RepID=UPI00164F8020|nr:hypothetical protein [Paenibacillus sp. N3.4]
MFASTTGCEGKESPPTTSPTIVSVLPSTDVVPTIVPVLPSTGAHSFKPYTDHVPPNPEVMGVEERKKLPPVGQELVALLDDYVYVFNHNVPQKEGDKFAAVDTASTGDPQEWPTPGKHYIKIKALPEYGFAFRVGVLDYTIVGDVELRHKATDDEPFWKGRQMFEFNPNDSNSQLILGYWNSPVK